MVLILVDVRFYNIYYIYSIWIAFKDIILTFREEHLLHKFLLAKPRMFEGITFSLFPHWPHPTLAETWHRSAPFLLQQALMLEGKSPIPVHTCQGTFTMSFLFFFQRFIFFLILADFLWKKIRYHFEGFILPKISGPRMMRKPRLRRIRDPRHEKVWSWKFWGGFSHQFQGRRGNLFLCVCYKNTFIYVYLCNDIAIVRPLRYMNHFPFAQKHPHLSFTNFTNPQKFWSHLATSNCKHRFPLEIGGKLPRKLGVLQRFLFRCFQNDVTCVGTNQPRLPPFFLFFALMVWTGQLKQERSVPKCAAFGPRIACPRNIQKRFIAILYSRRF